MIWFKFRFNSSQKKINENLREHPINDWVEEKIKECIDATNRYNFLSEVVVDLEYKKEYLDLRDLCIYEAKALRQYYDS